MVEGDVVAVGVIVLLTLFLGIVLDGLQPVNLHVHFAQLHLQPAGQQDDGKGDRRYPQQRKAHPPVVDQQRDADDGRGEDGAPELRHRVGKGVLKARAVAHDGAGQVGEVPLVEKAQRQRPQFFRQCDAAALTLLIGPKIGHRVLHVMQQEDQRQNDDADDRVQQGVGAARALALQGRRECVQHISQAPPAASD